MIILVKHIMIDIFAIADIRYEILSYLDHFTLMRACCCKDWRAIIQRALNAVTHTDIINLGYMTACPNLVSIKIQGPIKNISHKLYMVTLPNIRTVEYVTYDMYDSINWHVALKSFVNTENILIDCKCQNSIVYRNYIVQWFLIYPKTKIFTLQNAVVYMDPISFDWPPVTLINCRIHTRISLTTVRSLTILNCTISMP
jgi:hypothetical protein